MTAIDTATDSTAGRGVASTSLLAGGASVASAYSVHRRSLR